MPLDRTPWTSETVMPWGEHEGTALDDVPPRYLMWLLEQRWIPDYPGLHAYLKANESIIHDQVGELEDEQGDVQGFATYEDYLKDYRGY